MDRGCTEVWVLTEQDNEPAIATYVSGGTPGRGAPVMLTRKLAEGVTLDLPILLSISNAVQTKLSAG